MADCLDGSRNSEILAISIDSGCDAFGWVSEDEMLENRKLILQMEDAKTDFERQLTRYRTQTSQYSYQ